mgnify:CR=1 FL=1
MRAAQSPLFEPVLWDGDGFKILDETSLPEKIEYISVHEVAQALDAVREMKTRAFGQVLTLLYSGGLVARDYQGGDPEGLREKLAQMTQEFCAVRPTFDFKGIGIFFTRWFAELPADRQFRFQGGSREHALDIEHVDFALFDVVLSRPRLVFRAVGAFGFYSRIKFRVAVHGGDDAEYVELVVPSVVRIVLHFGLAVIVVRGGVGRSVGISVVKQPSPFVPASADGRGGEIFRAAHILRRLDAFPAKFLFGDLSGGWGDGQEKRE